jgi:hypothetical protein
MTNNLRWSVDPGIRRSTYGWWDTHEIHVVAVLRQRADLGQDEKDRAASKDWEDLLARAREEAARAESDWANFRKD